MELAIMSLFLLGVTVWFVWRHFREVRFITTRHTVHCPLYDYSAHLNVRTKFQPQMGPRHVDVGSCSLQHQEPISPPQKVVWVPDLPYSDLRFQKGQPAPIHVGDVPCRKDCLHLLNLAEGHCEIGQKRCIFGVMDSPELAREAARNTDSESSTLQMPWTYA